MTRWCVTVALAVLHLVFWHPGGEAQTQEGSYSVQAFNALLAERVDAQGGVDYVGLKGDQQRLNLFLDAVATLEPQVYQAWGTPAKIAFWLNVYNASILKIIVDHYPIRAKVFKSLVYPKNSIKQIGGALTGIRFPVMGRPMSPHEIEHEVLRRRFAEPRIHLALVCGARGCPPLRAEAYDGARLDQQLRDQTERFLRRPDAVKIGKPQKRVYLSPIFKWFKKDFGAQFTPQPAADKKLYRGHGKSNAAVLHFIAQHVDEERRRYLQDQRYTVGFQKYDWALNARQVDGDVDAE